MTSHAEQITQLHELAQEAMLGGDLQRCHQLCLSILKIDSKHADAWFFCGVIAQQNGLLEKASEIIRNAIKLAPDRAEYHAELGKCLFASGELELALTCAKAAEALQPDTAVVLNTLATLLSHCGEHKSALQHFTSAGKLVEQGLSPSDTQWLGTLYFNWGASLQFAGEFETARSHLEKSIEYQPDYYRAHFALSNIKRQTENSNHIERLRSLKEKVSNPRDRLHVGHALAKELEDLEQYGDAFASLDWAKSAQREATEYDFTQDQILFKKIRSQFETNWFEKTVSDCDSAEPIFIVGMPRTGTTLVEQVLSSHSMVFAAGELQNFPIQLRRCAGLGPGPLDAQAMQTIAGQPIAGLGKRYIDSTRPRTGHTPRFIDKLPLNFLYLGLVHKALPNAKIICLRRDPMDVCLSNYRQLFASNFSYYRYNLDLLDCGHYYVEFDRLMAHWHELMPGIIHEVHYESLVTNPGQVTKDLLNFCDLPWEDNCLKFNEQKTSVATPSAVQVREGIYTSSVERWRKYGDAMMPLLQLLTDAGFYE